MNHLCERDTRQRRDGKSLGRPMRIVEIIQLRAAGKPLELLSDLVTQTAAANGIDAGHFAVYRRESLETDLAVLIRRETAAPAEPSEAGVRLAAALKTFGLVQHTVWRETV